MRRSCEVRCESRCSFGGLARFVLDVTWRSSFVAVGAIHSQHGQTTLARAEAAGRTRTILLLEGGSGHVEDVADGVRAVEMGVAANRAWLLYLHPCT